MTTNIQHPSGVTPLANFQEVSDALVARAAILERQRADFWSLLSTIPPDLFPDLINVRFELGTFHRAESGTVIWIHSPIDTKTFITVLAKSPRVNVGVRQGYDLESIHITHGTCTFICTHNLPQGQHRKVYDLVSLWNAYQS